MDEDAQETLTSQIHDLSQQVAEKDERIAELEQKKITADFGAKVSQR